MIRYPVQGYQPGRWLHGAYLEDLLDRAEREPTGTVRHPARRNAYVRLLRALSERAPGSPAAPVLPRTVSVGASKVWAGQGRPAS